MRVRLRHLVVSMGLGFAIVDTATAAAIGHDLSANGRFLTLHIQGPIAPGDADQIKTLVQSKPKQADDLSWLTVRIDSTGGSVREALSIGRILRSENALISLGSMDVCQSSCVFILMSGVTRIASNSGGTTSRVGIHRPYLSDAEVGQNFERAYRDLRIELETYFNEMRVSRALLDLVYSVRPEDMRFLTNEQLAELLPLDDPVYDEKRTTALAKRYGLTNAEYRSRNAQADICRQRFNRQQITFGEIEPCEQAILWGVSLSEYLLRQRLSTEICVTGKLSRSQFGIPESLSPQECASRIMRNGV